MNKLIELDELKLELKNTQKLYLESLNKIDKAIEYTKRFINGKTSRIDEWENVELVLETIVEILGGINEHRK